MKAFNGFVEPEPDDICYGCLAKVYECMIMLSLKHKSKHDPLKVYKINMSKESGTELPCFDKINKNWDGIDRRTE